MPADEPEEPEESRLRVGARTAEVAQRSDKNARLVGAVRFLRRVLPGDPELGGDPLSTAGDRAPHVLARQISEAAPSRESWTREAGLGALQVFQAFSESRGRGRGDAELTILFTDLVDFSSWALEAGDDAAIELLRRVANATERPVTKRRGEIVKRLGDGMLAVFDRPDDALEAAHEAVAGTAEVEVAGHRPALRAGLHLGRPRRLGGDYLGVDVNIAARVMDAAGPGEVLISQSVCSRLDPEQFALKRKRRFRAKGAPKDLEVYCAEPAPG